MATHPIRDSGCERGYTSSRVTDCGYTLVEDTNVDMATHPVGDSECERGYTFSGITDYGYTLVEDTKCGHGYTSCRGQWM